MSGQHRYPLIQRDVSPENWGHGLTRNNLRPSSIDAEIDSLTNMLADMENNSPFLPRPRQSYDVGPQGLASYPPPPPVGASKPLPAYKPTGQSTPGHHEAFPASQPPAYSGGGHPGAYGQASQPGAYTQASQPAGYTQAPAYTQASQAQAYTQASQSQPGAYTQTHIQAPAYSQGPAYTQVSQPGAYAQTYPQAPAYNHRPYPQPVAASYTTASSSAGPGFNVQVKVAQPVPSYTQPGRQAEQAFGPNIPRPQPPPSGFVHASKPRYPPEPAQQEPQPQPWYPQAHYATAPPHKAHYRPAEKPGPPFQAYPGKKGPFVDELPPPPPPPPPPATNPSKAPHTPQTSNRPEEELDRLTKKLVYDMNNPPTEDYFGRCARCGENVVGDGTGCIAMDHVFHVDCFTCITCRCQLRGQPFYAIDRKSYCEACYINTLEQCSVCSQPIMDRILRAMGRAYHPQCFTCVMCGRCLDGIPFTVDTTSQIHCIEDFHMKFAPRCSVCAKPIMPEPGQEETVRIVALDRSFHVNCYKCEDCGLILSSEGEGRGCYPLDGHILCKACSARHIQHLSTKVTTDC
eukprot:gi/632991742/ref/XP_007884766.1/ PREDICTED: thyroid receptor-interacting protein 6-like [Callorhinchus milii]